ADVDGFARAYWGERDAYDRGWSDAAYWRRVGSRLGVTVTDELVTRLTDTDEDGWLHTVPESRALVDELRGDGVGVAILSNAPASFARRLMAQDWVRPIEHVLVSGEIGAAKPDAAIWAELIARLGAHPREIVFFDDRVTNVTGAREAGLTAEPWTDAAAGRARLVELGVLSR
ncbi:MAG: HAD-IA family hydrolase, partial [Streptosporangiales bacterium]|nr:HAD-IA family hydrolase [Streptosporangiales bacterium]